MKEILGIIGAMIERPYYREAIRKALARSRVVVLSGPRQCGKTTLAREVCPADSPNYFDLENPAHLAMLEEPMTALRGYGEGRFPAKAQRRGEGGAWTRGTGG